MARIPLKKYCVDARLHQIGSQISGERGSREGNKIKKTKYRFNSELRKERKTLGPSGG